MSAYVPPFLKEKSYQPLVKAQPLVNTSLPAKEAPVLTSGTLASLTSSKSTNGTERAVYSVTNSLSNMRLGKPLTKVVLTDDDFPSLGSKKPVIVKENTMNFAALSRDWAKKQEEDKLIAKEEANKESHRYNVERSMREKAEKESNEFRNRTIVLPSRKQNDTRTLDIGCHESDHSDESYESPPEYDPEEEEEEEDEEYNAHWER